MLSNPPPPESHKPAVSATRAGAGAQTCSKLLAGAAGREIIKPPFLLSLLTFGEGHSWHMLGLHDIMMFFVLMMLIEQENNTVIWSTGTVRGGDHEILCLCLASAINLVAPKGRCFCGFSFHFWCCGAFCRNFYLSSEMIAYVKALVLRGTWEHS